MNIGSFLKSVGGAVLKNVPMGNMIYDVVDVLLDDKLPDNITGNELVDKINSLPPDVKERVLSKQIDADLKKYQTWADLHEKMEQSSPMSKSRSVVMGIFAILVALVTMTVSYIFVQDYLMHQNVPSMDMLMVAYGIPSICLLASFGIKSDKILDLILSSYIKSRSK